jgi:hypothetical protein
MRDANATTDQVYKFTIILSGIDQLTDALADAIYEAGCDDPMLCCVNSVVSLDFDRLAASLERRSALPWIRFTAPDLRSVRSRSVDRHFPFFAVVPFAFSPV